MIICAFKGKRIYDTGGQNAITGCFPLPLRKQEKTVEENIQKNSKRKTADG